MQWAAFAYLGVVSMFLGFFAWYHGLAIGPITQVSQVQLVQPVLSICWAALLLGEQLTWTTVVGGLAVIICAGAAVRVRLGLAWRRSAVTSEGCDHTGRIGLGLGVRLSGDHGRPGGAREVSGGAPAIQR